MTNLPTKRRLHVPGWPEQNDLHALLGAALREGKVNEEEMAAFVGALSALLAGRAKQLSGGMSSSMPTERAERLAESTLYLIGLALMSLDENEAVERLLRGSLNRLLIEGRGVLDRKNRAVARFMPYLRASAIPVSHAAYQFAVQHADRAFYASYDPDWGAHELNWTPEYMPCLPLVKVGGILYLQAYLQALHTENLICRAAPPELLTRLLERAGRFSEEHQSPFYALMEELDPAGTLAGHNLCALLLDGICAAAGGRGEAAAEVVECRLGLRGEAACYARKYCRGGN